MIVNETELRQIIREELIHELLGVDEIMDYWGEKYKDWSGPTVSGEDLTNALDWGLIGFAFVADFIPGIGTGFSTAANLGSIGLATRRENWLGAALGVSAILIPAVGDAIAGVGKAVQAGIKVPKPVLNKILQGLSGVGKYELSTFLTSNATKVGIEISDEAVMGMTKALGRFKKDIAVLAA